jgi:predicted permease
MGLRSAGLRVLAQVRSWLRAALHRSRLESDMEAELANHLECMTDDLIRAGLAPAEAARRARILLGSSLPLKEEMRASLGLRWWDELRNDLRYAGRMLKKSPGFTAIAAASLALAIGANTTIFSFARQVLYERLAVPNAGDLRLLSWTGTEEHVAVHGIWGDYDPLPGGLRTSTAFSYLAFQQLRAENRVLDDLFAFNRTSMNATVHGTARRIRGEMVSGNYYAALGVQPTLGRGIAPADDQMTGNGHVAVISYGLWQREFGGSPSALGQVVRVNETPLTIVGVNPKEFTSAKDVQTPADVFMPISLQPQVSPQPGKNAPLSDPSLWWVNVMGRAREGTSDAQAQAALDTQLGAIVRGTMPVAPNEDLPRLVLRDGSRGLFEQQRVFAKPMAVLMTLVSLVLVLACANIANLMLARGAQRQREMNVRLALGAGKARVFRQMLVESLLLASIGGAGGLVAAYVGRNAIPKMIENSWEQIDLHVQFDWRVFGFAAAITILTGILFGLAPAVAAAHTDLNRGLKEATQSTTRRRKGFSGRALVSFQIALSTLLVIGAGLFLRTLAGLTSVDVGFRTDHLLLFELNPQRTQYPPGKDVELHRRLERAFAAVPGVEAVTAAGVPYIAETRSRRNFVTEGPDPAHINKNAEYYNVVGNRFFNVLGIPIIAGRGFEAQDTATSPKAGVINQSLARARFPNRNPVGSRFAINTEDGEGRSTGQVWIQIVGVCADNRYDSLRNQPPPQFFLPFVQQKEVGALGYEIRTAMKPEAILPALRSVVHEVDPDLPLNDVRTQDQQIAAAMQQERVFVILTSGFGLLALALASVGIYGVMAYSVAQRTNEIGIRLALGAKPGQVQGMILRESSWLSFAGVASGLIGSLLLARTIQSLLFGIRAYDPFTYVAGVMLLLLVALAASWIPARRAAGVQPMDALRHE